MQLISYMTLCPGWALTIIPLEISILTVILFQSVNICGLIVGNQNKWPDI